MKGIVLIAIALLTTGCCNSCYTTEVVQYRQVRVAPVTTVTRVTPVVTRQVRVTPVIPVVTRVVAPVVQPVIIDAGYIEPLDVTTTTIDFY